MTTSPDPRAASRTGAVPPEATVSYEQWGVEFFDQAVTEERILGTVNLIAGQPIDVGPLGVGPGRLAKVRAYGSIGAASATRLRGQRISYRLVLPVDLAFEVDLQVETHRFSAQLLVPLTLTAVALPGLRVFIDATPPTPHEVRVDLRAQGLRASVLQRVVNVEAELRRFVAGYVRRELEKPHVRDARMIDIARAIDQAWDLIAPRGGQEEVAADLNEALAEEIREHEDALLDVVRDPD